MFTPLFLLALANPSVVPLEPKGPWGVQGEDGLCLLARQYQAPEGDLTIGFQPVASQESMEIVMRYPSRTKGFFRYGKARLTLLPNGTPVEARYSSDLLPKGERYLRFNAPRSIFDDLPQASALSISADTNVVLALKNPAGAVAALRDCQGKLLQKWGIDPAAFAVAKTPPRMTDIAKWFSHRAYPKAALTKHISGRVVMAIQVGADGAMQPCRVVVSSGSAELDRGSCAIIDKHGPITPAIDAAGRPVASWLIMPVRWLTFG